MSWTIQGSRVTEPTEPSEPPGTEPVPSSTRRRLFLTSVEMEIPFHDIDALRIVWHGHYYKYFEIARTQLFRERGIFDVLKRADYTLVVIESQARYIAPLEFGDRIRVHAWLKDTELRVNVAYEIENLTRGGRVCRGHTILATVTSQQSILLETPRELKDCLAESS